MKNLKIKLFICSVVISISALAANRIYNGTVTNDAEFMAASSTNSNKGAALDIFQDGATLDGVSIYASASGKSAGTTNAAKNATLTVYLERSWDNVNWDYPTNSDLKLVIPLSGVVTQQVSIYRNLGGARYLRRGRTENTALDGTTNIITGVSGIYQQ